MNKPDTWYVQKGVELLGWDQGRYEALIAKVGPDIVHDHIAAQLVRQYYAAVEVEGSVNPDHYCVYERDPIGTIMMIVDSKVLSECTKSDTLQTNDD